MQVIVNSDHNIVGRESLVTWVRGQVEDALSRFADQLTRVDNPPAQAEPLTAFNRKRSRTH